MRLFTKPISGSIPKQKICRDCKFYIPNARECGKNPNINLVTGVKTYESAIFLRQQDGSCGPHAKDFEENHFKIVTAPYYFMRDWWMIAIPFTYIIFFIKCKITASH